jgi:two-component system CheB/CheR fusion protein
VGASAGGLEAFKQFLEGMPDDTGMTFVLVQHLAPGYESTLPALLGSASGMHVEQVEDGTLPQPNHVYVIPPNVQMEIDKRRLRLTPRPTGRSQYMPIDHFFRSLAGALGNRAVGIVLSGNASDGAMGLREIKAAGGLAIAQDPATAAFGGMPHAAIATGVVDLVLPVREMARHLIQFLDHPYAAAPVDGDGGMHEQKDTLAASDGQLGRIFTLLRNAKGVDFSLYKPPTIRRRIQRRMAMHKVETLEDYIGLLKAKAAEVEALYHDILIQVTHFFREPEALDAMVRLVFPRLLKDRPVDAPLRVWIPGCATGEEVYSITILLLEALGADERSAPVQIFGTDVSEASVDYARNGAYPEAIREHVSPERLRRFFTFLEGTYRINKNVRELCVFARQDLSRDPPFSRLDMIVCRNVLIYLGAPLQKRLISVFHYALKTPGFLVLGKAETAGFGDELFTPIDKKQRIYLRRPVETGRHTLFPSDQEPHRRPETVGLRPAERGQPSIIGQANQYMLDHYTPPGVLVDGNLHIVQFRGQTGAYLEPAPGSASLNLLKMAREGLVFGLRTALHTARKKGVVVRKEGLRVRANEGYREVSIEVSPIGMPDRDMHFLITFHEIHPKTGDRKPGSGRRPRREPPADGRLHRPQQELAASREYLQSMIQDLEAANEELQSANEEILSSNEELQSTNEELDTAKEELQSINEELNTVNEELQGRNDELNRVNSDLVNLLGSVQIAVVMVNSDLKIRRFTPTAEKLFNLIPGDLGRPIGNIQPAFDGPNLHDLITEVTEGMTTRTSEVRDKEGRWYRLSIRPYKRAGNQIDGAVLVLYDIDAVRREETRSLFNRELARGALELTREPVLVVDADLRVKSLNRSYARRYAISEDEACGRRISDLPGGLWEGDQVAATLADLLSRNGGSAELQVRDNDDGDGKPARVTARRITGEDGRGAIVLILPEEKTTDRAAPR